jgi:tetratricopeptide (TPR) repeat protein
VATAADIDRLIEEGLSRYGAGDLDGALLLWEQALAIDPENPQANSYVDYVRSNYDVLQTDQSIGIVDDAGFGIADEPEYIIEISPGDGQGVPAPMYMDPLDEGWFIEEEATRDFTREAEARTISADLPPQQIELEAEEPPDSELELPLPRQPSEPAVTFESSTREYGKENEFEDAPSSFKAESTPLGFGTMETEVRRRELGFVQPTQPARLEVKLRTPTSPPHGADLELAPSNRGEPEPHRTQRGLAPVVRRPAEDDLISSLPSPRQPSANAEARIVTRDLPEPRLPAVAHTDDGDLALPTASTRDLGERNRVPTAPASPAAIGISSSDLHVTAAPTRDLGLRPGGRPPSVYPDEDAPTRQSDARAIREHNTQRAEDGTKQDIVLPFDPIDARSGQILDELDAEVAPDESKDERTRRRITALLDRAIAWNSQDELDKAATAVELALSEDPNSALAQKLIQRNRETIMTVFQNFLGDLERQPQLARPLHELAQAPISPRAAFLLSRIDGTLSLDEILDVSGMPRLEAYRHLCQLFLRGILR